MSSADPPIGALVETSDTGRSGIVRFCGTTLFAPGKWVAGIELLEPRARTMDLSTGWDIFRANPSAGVFIVCPSQVRILCQIRTTPVDGP